MIDPVLIGVAAASFVATDLLFALIRKAMGDWIDENDELPDPPKPPPAYVNKRQGPSPYLGVRLPEDPPSFEGSREAAVRKRRHRVSGEPGKIITYWRDDGDHQDHDH